MKKLEAVNYISLVLLVLTLLVFMARALFGVAVSDNLLRVNGVVTLISLPVFVFTYIRMKINK